MSNAIIHAERRFIPTHGVAVPQVGIVLGFLIKSQAIAYPNCINQIISRFIVHPRNAVTNIFLVHPHAYKIVKIHMTLFHGLSISQAPRIPGHSRRLSQRIFGEPKLAIGRVGSPT